MKILFGRIGYETNTFAPGTADLDRWAPNGLLMGDDIFTQFRNTPDYLGGMIRAAEDHAVELIPGVAVHDIAGPKLTTEAVEFVVGELVRIADARRGEYAGICMMLHGAGCAENTDDLEAYTLERLREVVGPDMPITAALDLHGNITPQMVELSNGLFGCKLYPHTDMAEAGYLAMKTLIGMLRGEVPPQTALVQLPLLVFKMGQTSVEPLKSVTAYIADYVDQHHLIDATFFQGFAAADVPSVGASVVVVAENGAAEAASEIAKYIWDIRGHMKADDFPMPDAAVDLALAELNKPGGGYIVINETSDNAGGGAPGDGTHLLREILTRNLPKAIFGYMYDPEIAALAHEVGVGGKVSGLLGAKTDELHGTPIELRDATVCALSNGNAIYVTPMYAQVPVSYGKTARLRVGNVEIIVTQNLYDQTYDDRPFLLTGADITQYHIICVKSAVHFRAFFESRAKAIVTTDPPGLTTGKMAAYSWHRARRPIYPIDLDTAFDPLSARHH
ncbi:M81 family metallopeptidase [Mesorhizobium erdmanii]|uniref:M81 family metallopeptidase n=1 Tax=Mesorhizobium erdmanii TaxID=1777866 RepID=UPI00042903C2|nr:M81 family metallopeptidase [Mesorhizobium erdmanii]